MDKRKNSIISFIGWLTAALFYGYHNMLISLINVSSGTLIDHLMISTTQFGLIPVAQLIGYTAMQIPAGILLDHYSLKRLMTGALLTLTLGCFLLSFSQHYLLMIVVRFLMGTASAFAVLGAFKVATDWFESKLFATLAGLTVTLGYFGGLTQPIVYLSQYYSLEELFFGLGIAGGVLALSAFIFIDNYNKVARKFEGYSEMMQDMKKILYNKESISLILYAMLIFTPLLIIKDALGALFFKSYYGYEPSESSQVMDVILYASMVAAPLLGIISDRMGKRRPILIATPILLLVCFLAVFIRVDTLFNGFFSTTLIFSLFGFITWGFLISYTVFKETHSPNIVSTGLGLMNSINMVGGILAVPLITLIIDQMPRFFSGISTADQYFYAFMLLPFIIIAALPLLKHIPETNCQQQA